MDRCDPGLWARTVASGPCRSGQVMSGVRPGAHWGGAGPLAPVRLRVLRMSPVPHSLYVGGAKINTGALFVAGVANFCGVRGRRFGGFVFLKKIV